MPLYMQRSFLKQVRELLDRNLTINQIAHRLGVNSFTVTQSLNLIQS